MAAKKYLDLDGLTTFLNNLKSTFVLTEAGKGLSSNDYTDADKTKLAGISTGAEANTIETVKVNNTALTPDEDKAINISVPTTAAEVGALAGSTKYGATLSLEMDSSTYVVTATLKDQDGNTLGTAQTIDLPLESVVVSGSYDATNKKVVLTLKDGSTVDFSVADLVAGLQTEITSTNKLSADLVDDSATTNKFVTSAEKTKIANALASGDNVSALTNDAGYVTADTAATVAITTTEINNLFV